MSSEGSWGTKSLPARKVQHTTSSRLGGVGNGQEGQGGTSGTWLLKVRWPHAAAVT